ncbi:Hsp70 family protein [Gordonia sp. LSe1-13]|uniref:Hsp70 family protein n=1 Tax=Gordonia sesuvii TaxID=3116777 RepID=A0ABU7MGM0_9ACTN|nr:Hsp70 family protein [Gordonia sp. LSe1-13]
MTFAAWTLAIDFGTSNSAAAHSGATSGGIETLSLSHTSNLMPSAVYVAGPGGITVGDAAINAAQQNPAGFVASPKRLIGADPTSTVNGQTMPTYALVSAVIGAILARGKAAHAGAPPAQVVLTHPEAWAHQQIRVLIDAAAAAGIHPSRITTISEPRAAAAHYSRSHAMQPGARIAVFDFGGGTLDIAVLTVTAHNSFEVIAARGDNGLGGKNLDAVIGRWVSDRVADRDPDLANWLNREAPVDVVQSLQDSIRHAKELLSEAPSATITVPTPTGRTTLQITRDEFDELIGPAVGQAIQLTRAALYDAGITHPTQLTALYLTGGSSRIPLIQQRLNELGPVATLDDPKTVVAQGALVTAIAEATPRTNERPTPVPGAADLMPPPASSPPPSGPRPPGPQPPRPQQTGPSSGPKKSGRRWGRVAAVAVGVVAVVGIGAGAVALMTSGDEDPNPDIAAESSPAGGTGAEGTGAGETAAGETGKDGGRILTDDADLMAALPGPLQASVDNCRKTGFNQNDAVEMMCDIADDGSLAELGSPDALSYFIMFHVDDNEADSMIVDIRNGIFSNGDGELVEDANRVSAADIAPRPATSDYKIDYANTSSGLNLKVFGVASVEDGRTFLTRSGLMS